MIENLVKVRDRLLTDIEKYFDSCKDVEMIFIGGSIAKGNPDEFSDIDFRIVVSKQLEKSKILVEFLDYFQDKIAFVETLADNYAVVHFKSFIKLDIFVYYKSDLSPTPWTKDILILIDKDDFLKNLREESKIIETIFTSEELTFILNKYVAYMHELYRRTIRKEYNYAEYCTLMMKNSLVSLWLIEKGEIANSFGDWSKYEGNRSKLDSYQKRFLKKYTPVEFGEIGDFAKNINDEILKATKHIVEIDKLGIEYNKYEKLINYLNWNDMN
ncbi:nucleotidyltransferase domain-containing protein [Floricoccus tropicus]|nr:nucleotidyltransferase domain-containing protein [Floricoccus tropicus]